MKYSDEFEKDVFQNEELLSLISSKEKANELYRTLCDTYWTKDDKEWFATHRTVATLITKARNLSEHWSNFYYENEEKMNIKYDWCIDFIQNKCGWSFSDYWPNLEEELHNNEQVLKFVRNIENATNLYRALCNNNWYKNTSNVKWSCSWRYAGVIISELRNIWNYENYLDFYCSGMEGLVTEDVEKLLNEMGWSYKEIEVSS